MVLHMCAQVIVKSLSPRDGRAVERLFWIAYCVFCGTLTQYAVRSTSLTKYHSSPYLIGTDVIAHRYINEEVNMGGFKEAHAYELNEDHVASLKEMAE